MEMGSFLELELRKSGEYFADGINIARLNSGRSGIYHALRVMKCNTIYLPYYLCPDVKVFLQQKSVSIKQYNISDDFEPILDANEKKSAILIVNYFGLFSLRKLMLIKERYKNVIIDNCGAFFMQSLNGCYNIYSCRKFFGVPDGCYVIGPNAGTEINSYLQDQSSDTSAFLFMRFEKGCSGSYEERMRNEERINSSDILRMSQLTKSLMSSLDYERIKKKRKENYKYARRLYDPYNLIKLDKFTDDESIPNFYPLVIKDEELVEKMKDRWIYTGRRWIYVLKEKKANLFEVFLSSYMVPIPVDQRYGKEELNYCFKIFKKVAYL